MNRIFRLAALVLTVALAFSLFSCGADNGSGGNADNGGVVSVILSETNIEATGLGTTYELTAKIIDSEASENPEADIVWYSSDESVAVCEGGKITVLDYGICTIKAKYKNKSAMCIVSVPNPNPSLAISKDRVRLEGLGATTSLSVITDRGVNVSESAMWITSNSKIATVNSGVVQTTGYGICTVTAIYDGVRASCSVEVRSLEEPKLTLSTDTVSLKVGEKSSILASQDAANVNTAVTWMSSDPSVVSCDKGKLTAHKDGTCVIIATSESGAYDYAIVTVGSYRLPGVDSELVNFSFPNVYKEMKYVSRATGQVDSAAVVYAYTVDTELNEDKGSDDYGRLYMDIYLKCVKIYDVDGLDGDAPVYVVTELYTDNDILRERKEYKYTELKVGDAFSVTCSKFSIQTSEGTKRNAYMKFAEICEY